MTDKNDLTPKANYDLDKAKRTEQYRNSGFPTASLEEKKRIALNTPPGPMNPVRQKGMVTEKQRKKELDARVQELLVETLENGAVNVLEVVMEQAKEGCRASQKIVLDRIIPTRKATDKDIDQSKGNIIINVSSLDVPTVERVIEGDE